MATKKRRRATTEKPSPRQDDSYFTDGQPDHVKHGIAGRLTAMVGHRLTLNYQPTSYYDNEDGDNTPSKGHLYCAYIKDDESADSDDFGECFHVTLDDRRGDIRLQFIAELRR